MLTRRDLIGGAAAIAASGLASRGACADYRSIPQHPSCRVIIDNDFAGDPDGLIALAHQLLTPKTRTVLVTTTGLDPQLVGAERAKGSAARGREVALELMRRAGLAQQPPVIEGAAEPEAAGGPGGAAARAIVAEAMRDDPLPLFFTCGGPLTNLADALRLEPRIAGRMTVIWIGGGAYPAGGWEYNLSADIPAARVAIEGSPIALWQIPQPAYRQMQFSVAALADRLRTISPFGAWLYDRFTTLPAFVKVGGSWPLGDSPTVLFTALSTESSAYADRPARRIKADCTYGDEIAGRSIRVFETLDARLTFDDFLALMQLHARQAR